MPGQCHREHGPMSPTIACLLHRWPGHLSLARFGSPQSAEAQKPAGRQVSEALLAAHPSARLRAHPALRLLGQSSACHHSAALRSAAGCGTQTNGLFLRKFPSPVSLPQVRWTDEGHRTAHGCRPATSFSSRGHRCGMKRLSPTPKLRVLRRARHSSVSLSNTTLPLASRAPHFVISLLRPPHLRPCWPLLRSTKQPRHTSTPLLPTFEFP